MIQGDTPASGETWNTAGLTNPTIYILAIDPTVSAMLYAITWDDAVFKSINGGGDWSEIDTVFPAIVAIDPITPTNLFALW